jgi:O-antigen/teichoic acid export membrane protein
VLIWLKTPLAGLLKVESHPEYLLLSAFIIALDALAAIPFARLRQEGRPLKFASIRIGGILVNIACVYFFLSLCPAWVQANKYSWVRGFFNPEWAVGYVLVANLAASALTLVFLYRQLLGFQWRFDGKLWKELLLYGAPLILAGFAGMINETFDRIMLGWWAPVPSETAAKAEVGIYSACYKLSILITLAVQAFRMGAEPFFFKQAQQANAQRTYARVMKFFVITLCVMFLAVVLYLDVWKYFVNKKMWAGLKVVPILLLANMFLGIYYNLSVWYKLGNKTMAGAWITVVGAAITLLINAVFIPLFSYTACAWATFFCYGSMMVISYVWGQKVYRIPYARKKLLAYLVISILLYFVFSGITYLYHPLWFSLLVGTALMLVFLQFLLIVEKKELAHIPVVKKWVR